MKESLPRIVFFQIKTAQQKLQKLSQTAYHHFDRKISLCIITPNDEAKKFVDELLWKEPLLSFLPHGNSPDDLIAITSKKENLNKATHFFNLRPNALFVKNNYIIYEFDDQTSLIKQELSQKKYREYREKGYIIESR